MSFCLCENFAEKSHRFISADKIYVIDDGAKDGVEKVLEKYNNCNIIPILRDKNLGIVDNFQDVLQRLDTTHAMMLGADNYLHPNTLEVLEKEKEDIVSYDIVLFGTEAKEFASRRTCQYINGYYVWKFAKGGAAKTMELRK